MNLTRSQSSRRGRGWAGVAFGYAIATLAAYQQFKIPVVLPVLLDQYGYDRTLAGGFMSVYALAGLVLSLLIGRTIERRGVVPAVGVALALIVAGSVVTLVWPERGAAVLFGRALEGCAFAVLAICGPVVASAQAPPGKLPIVIGIIATWMPIGQLAAAGLAPFAVAGAGWELLWIAGIAATLVLGAVTAALRGAGPPFSPAPGGRVGRNVNAAPLGARCWIALSLAGAVFMFWSGQYFALMTWLPQYLVEVHDFAPGGALAGYATPIVLVVVFNLLTGVLLRAGIALGTLLVIGLVSQTVVWWLLPMLGAGGSGLAVLVLYGCGAGIVPVCLFAIPSAVVGPGTGTASAFGYIMTGRNLGALSGPILLAELVKRHDGWDEMAAVLGVLTVVAIVLGAALAAALRRR